MHVLMCTLCVVIQGGNWCPCNGLFVVPGIPDGYVANTCQIEHIHFSELWVQCACEYCIMTFRFNATCFSKDSLLLHILKPPTLHMELYKVVSPFFAFGVIVAEHSLICEGKVILEKQKVYKTGQR